MKLEVIDNFLAVEQYNYILDLIDNRDFSWNYCPGYAINGESQDDLFMFTHFLADRSGFHYEGANKLMDPIMLRLKELKKYNFEIIRAKLNLFTKSSKNLRYGFHFDVEDESIKYETIIYYLNTNNGGTEFDDGTIVRSQKNRALIVYGKVNHQSVGQTDRPHRTLFNINYKRV